MKYLRSFAGVVGSECAVLLAIAAMVLVMSGSDNGFEAIQFAQGNF